MSDRPPCPRTLTPRRISVGLLAQSLALALTGPGCSPEPASSQGGGGTTSKVPEIAKRQKYMQDMLKKGESNAKSPPEAN